MLMKNTPNFSDPMDDEILTVEQVAKLLHLEPSTIYTRVETGDIPGAFRLGEGERPPLRFSKRVLMEWIQKEASRP